MSTKEKVYDAFAELIYSVVMADGEVTAAEKTAISQIVKQHPIGINIQNYFDSKDKDLSIAQCFIYTLETCKAHGADEEYPFLLTIVEEISKVSEGVDDDGLFVQFVKNFKKRFSIN